MALISKFHIAESQFFDAIKLYLDGNYLSAATLAGTSEEILGKILESKGRDSCLTSTHKSQNTFLNELGMNQVKIKTTANKLNRVPNNLKHISTNEKGGYVANIRFNPEIQSIMLRALYNYEALKKNRPIKSEMRIAIHKFRVQFWINNDNYKNINHIAHTFQ